MLYPVVFFALSHPVVLGVSVPALASIPGFIGTFITGLLWTLAYRQSRSLRWPIFGHVLADLTNMSVFVFLNMAVING